MADSENTRTLSKIHSRREFIAVAGGLAAATAAAGAVAVNSARAGEHPDAELIRLGREFEQQLKRKRDAEDRMWTFRDLHEKTCKELAQARGLTRLPSRDDLQVQVDCGYDDAIGGFDVEAERLTEVVRAIWRTPAKTATGLLIWARASFEEAYHLDHFDEPEDDMDWDHFAAFKLYSEIARLAAQEGGVA